MANTLVVLIDEHLVPIAVAEADEPHEVHAMNSGEQLDLGLELESTLHGSLFGSLDRNELHAGELSLVNLSSRRLRLGKKEETR